MEANPYDGNLDQSDIKTPVCKLNIGDAKNKSKFTFNNGEMVDSIKGARVLVGGKNRVLFGNKLGDEALCGSRDYWHPNAYFKDPPATECEKCVLQMWPNSMGFDQTKLRDSILAKRKIVLKNPDNPVCQTTYMPLMIDENGKVFFLSLPGKNSTAFKNLVWSRLVGMAGSRPKFVIKFDLYSVEKTDGKTTWYEIEPNNFVDDERDGNVKVIEEVRAVADLHLRSHTDLALDYQQQNESKSEAKRLSAPIEISDVPPPESENDFSRSKNDDLPF